MTSSLGLIAPNGTALALSGTKTAGSASALIGVLQMAIGAILAPVVGLSGGTNAVPMAVAIAALGIATPLTLIALCYPGMLRAMARIAGHSHRARIVDIWIEKGLAASRCTDTWDAASPCRVGIRL
ncbi:MAG: hypothetical protein ACXWQ5_04045 [Ktedonobacterales bacterium]